MTVFTAHRRARAAAVVGGLAVLTGTVAGVASADPAVTREIGPDRTLILCTAPDGPGAPGLPPLADGAPGPRIHIERFDDAPTAPLPTLPGAPGADLPGDCTRIESGDAPGGAVLIRPPHAR
ncbi:hypothetical protein FEK33_26140 [Nocardia asteroides NBRC 15531]|uniref:Uncharacterized protein n=1 Tax=Nocardia asteroides NBRC 15531 TaxID=1110697 RepID=U5ELN1_NOCAS|nr:hypothetical protein [Nocardia asteroides]TLF63492.1 hypothetical protein FEK33_26140 [Nocardia asteroides NBRC 15531]UGT47061.1 hypothetical protein LT345_21375 [Nocardia asteroides]SFM80766.1 hypothetical protein SAMN05444423_104300 [Nocardia asteroides]VEG34065.1 Uncharacterised protein [Nocardia asteroides]GAD87223.1 hypothetical protein NCAST_34_03530 [Nocardia asteroides NBRC 15531]